MAGAGASASLEPGRSTPFGSPPARPNLAADGWLNSLGFEEVANFRDVAGVDRDAPALRVEGGRLRRGMLYRSSQLQFATPRDIAFMKEGLRLRTYIDLRNDEGVLETRDAEVYDAYPPSPIRRPGQPAPARAGERRRLSYSLLRGIGLRKLTDAEKSGSQDAEPDTWLQLAMRDPVTKRVAKHSPKKSTAEVTADLEKHLGLNNKAMLVLNGPIIAAVLGELVQQENYPIVFGCVTGKDRTGLISCLVLGCLGASDEDIIADYMLSQAAVQHNGLLASRNLRLAMAEHPEHFRGASPPSGGPSDPHNQVMASVFPGVMRSTLGAIRERGGFRAYLASIGFGADAQRRLRELLVEPDAGSRL